MRAIDFEIRLLRCDSDSKDLSSVIPFECKDISTCLDGFTNPPSYSQCVALGPTREDSIRLDFSKQKSGNNKVSQSLGVPVGASSCV